MRDCPAWWGSGFACVLPRSNQTVRAKSQIIFIFNFWQNKGKCFCVIVKHHTSREAGFSQTFPAVLAQPETVQKLKTVFREGEGAAMEGKKQFQCKVNYISSDQLVLT